MYLFGRLNGLASDGSSTWMRRVDEPDDLDGTDGFKDEAVEALSQRMGDVADLRVEELVS